MTPGPTLVGQLGLQFKIAQGKSRCSGQVQTTNLPNTDGSSLNRSRSTSRLLELLELSLSQKPSLSLSSSSPSSSNSSESESDPAGFLVTFFSTAADDAVAEPYKVYQVDRSWRYTLWTRNSADHYAGGKFKIRVLIYQMQPVKCDLRLQ
ncbi:hypothetical protein T265_04790 [Opisthorchis viverrini]|uniref:Uncharacterized protein n=1 Tax=Opisthorchis viverrini TaxID=6198 RepID=A0A075AG29_OPIVI|nr:hypothetical protein T265_04790 [Opisthorchis viverrini]KER28329.1 hypothetical protein T265_04790 [Opisthorchis viverrini]